MKYLLISFLTLLLQACSTTYQNQQILGKAFPLVEGTSLSDELIEIPKHFSGNNTLLLIGYKQASQFDIDRWLIGLDMTETLVDVYEIPTIQGLFPRMFSPLIDEGMRKGIPKELWKGVITVYNDGEKVQQFTGNENGNNARVVLLDKSGMISYFYDRGFSVQALNALRQQLVKDRR
ncbi:hypothetical protein KO525_13080 [Psychrosphaera sp. B3R10]|uniref:hypothetical protein n=1 Tax=unclassified Psychrosphaera TaxID=2641570 RepID=UPI001C07F0B6|nr:MULTISPECIES: hypothetical protein [unclassified Psychrosphaera]MBU2882493.1 hypothetical protein [Psychrosphaera sp. I2R16]MBU2990314.1 hypothetical protein [Psychrosphaera sp. B3R10]